MKKGKWNYTEDIEYTVVLVKLEKVENMPIHWQNAMVGKQIQALKVIYKNPDSSLYEFYIDNSDGSGLRKIQKGGGPDSYSAHLETFKFIKELPEEEWQQWDPAKHQERRLLGDQWTKENFPEEFAKMERLRGLITKINNNKKIQR